MSRSEPVPAALLRAAVESNRLRSNPCLPEGYRGEAVMWLTHVLTRNDAWQSHLTTLRQIMDLSPTPRLPGRDRRTATFQRMVDALHLQFPRRPALPEDVAFAILERGLEAATGETLAELLINPVALELLRAMVEDEQSEVWVRERALAARDHANRTGE